MLEDELQLAKQIRQGKLELICPEMELLVFPSFEEIALKGAGLIRSDDIGGLYFRMVAPARGAPHPSLKLSKLPGESYDNGDFVMLRAIDENGREWRSERLLVDLSREIPTPNYSIKKNLVSLLHSAGRITIGASSLRVIIPNSPSVPLNHSTVTRKSVGQRVISISGSVDHHEHRIGEADIVFRLEEQNLLAVSAESSKNFLFSWPGSICQALSWAVAGSVRPAVTVRGFDDREDLWLQSGPFFRHSSILPRPVYTRGPEGADDFWCLIERFVTYVTNDPVPGRSTALIDELEGIRRGSEGSFQTACLTMAIGIESIVNLVLGQKESRRTGSSELVDLIKHLAEWMPEGKLKTRVLSMLAALTNVRTQDVLYAWSKRTSVEEKLIDGWKDLRNPKAHGAVIEEKEGWGLYCSAAELMNRVVASAIGYEGPITKSSEKDWGLPWLNR